MPLEAYLYYEGRAEEALDYYAKNLNAKRTALMRYSETPDHGWEKHIGASNGDKVMHSVMVIDDGAFMLSDGMCSGEDSNFDGFALTLSTPDVALTEKRYNALAEEGSVVMPMSATFFAHKFGMVKDPFGVTWILISPLQN